MKATTLLTTKLNNGKVVLATTDGNDVRAKLYANSTQAHKSAAKINATHTDVKAAVLNSYLSRVCFVEITTKEAK